MMLFSIWALYTNHRYHWDPKHVGFSLTLVGVMSAIVQAVIARRIIGRIGDVRGVTLGLLLSATSQMLYGLAPHGWIVYLIIPLGSLAGIAGPAMQSYITQHVPPNEQGAVQGIYSGLASFAGIPGPLIAAWSFGWAVGPGQPAWLSGITFFIGAALALVASPSRCDRLPATAPPTAPFTRSTAPIFLRTFHPIGAACPRAFSIRRSAVSPAQPPELRA